MMEPTTARQSVESESQGASDKTLRLRFVLFRAFFFLLLFRFVCLLVT